LAVDDGPYLEGMKAIDEIGAKGNPVLLAPGSYWWLQDLEVGQTGTHQIPPNNAILASRRPFSLGGDKPHPSRLFIEPNILEAVEADAGLGQMGADG
jgi:hypothetical protein